MLAEIEGALKPQIEDLLRRSRAKRIPRVVRTLIETPEKWDDMNLTEKRDFLRSGYILLGIEVSAIQKGKRIYDTSDRVIIHWSEEQEMRDA
jgi:hypothetical protein